MKNGIKIRHIHRGWTSTDFESTLNEAIEQEAQQGFAFKDINVESNGENTLIIFERVGFTIVTN
jgi:hypothetical protein